MNDKTLLSVIIPVYNVEKYLAQTLDSVINQTYKNLEIICVNDGSKDNSRNILEEYKNKDSRIIIVDQENQGLAAARNTGLKHFTGELVAFLDSDDWLELDFYEKLIERLALDNSDIAVGETHYVYSDRISQTDWVNDFTFYKTHKDILESIEEKQNIIYACACWNKIYRADLIKDNNLEFPYGLFIEDVPFTFAATILANKISLVKGAVLKYRRQDESILAKAKENRTSFDIFKIYDVCENWLAHADLNDDVKEEYKNILENFEIFNINSWLGGTCPKYKQEFYKNMKNRIKNFNIKNNKYINKETLKIFYLIKNNNYEAYEKKCTKIKITFLEQLFSIRNEYVKKVVRILGFKISFKTRKLLDKYGIDGLSTLETFCQIFKPTNHYNYQYHYSNWHNDTTESKIKDLNDNELFLEYNKIYPTSPNSKILEIGCGMGRFMLTLIDRGYANVYGIDVDKSQIKIAKKENLRVKKIDGLKFLKRTKEKYDVIYCIDVLEHIEKNKQIEFLKQIYKHLNDDGMLVLRIPNALNPTMGKMRYEDFTHYAMYAPITIGFLLNNAGFFNYTTRQDWEESKELELLKKPFYDMYKLQYNIEPILTPNLITVAFKSRECLENYLKSAPKAKTHYNEL